MGQLRNLDNLEFVEGDNVSALESLKQILNYAGKRDDDVCYIRRAVVVAAVNEIKRLQAAVDRDKTGLAAGLNAVRKRLRGSSWLGESGAWGSYENGDRTEDNLRKEFAACLEEAEQIACAALRASGTLATKTLRGEETK